MSDLEMLLRDVRPAPDPIWAARLDARAAAGFPGPPPRWKAPLLAFRNHLFAFGAVGAVASMLIVLVFAATHIEVGGDDEGASSGGASAPAMSAPESVDQAARGADRAVLKNASITLSTRPDQVQEIADRAIRIVDTLGGYVQSSTIDTAGSRGSAELSLRIPAAKLDSGMAQISKLAPVRSRSQQAEDVTDQREALEARVRDARADRAGLRVRLGKATTDRERSRLRAQLDRASRRVTQRQRALAELGREVSYATVDLSIEGNRGSGGAVPGDRWTPGDALKDAGRVLEVIAGVLVIALAIALPLAILVVLATLAGRLTRRRRRERALGSA